MIRNTNCSLKFFSLIYKSVLLGNTCLLSLLDFLSSFKACEDEVLVTKADDVLGEITILTSPMISLCA